MLTRASIRVLAALLAAIALAAVVITASPIAAHADAADCEPTYLARDGRELFTLETKYIPPPLRAFPADCASRLIAEPFDDGEGISVSYALLYTDVEFETVLDILESFERAGWIVGGAVDAVDFGDGFSDEAGRSAADIAAVGQEAVFLRARFSDANTGSHLVEVTFADGGAYENDPALTTPSLVVTVFLNEAFGGTGLADPSVLSTLRTIEQALPSPTQAAVIGGSAVMLTLIMGYPGSLLGSVVSGRWDQFSKAARKRFRARAQPAEGAEPSNSAPSRRGRFSQPSWFIWIGFVASAVISGFIDPNFGVNWMSLRVILSALLGFAVFNLAVWMLTRKIIHRLEPNARGYIKFRWGSLVVVIAAVLIARLLEFNPGVIFGLVAGLAFGVALALSRSAIVVVLGSAFGLIAAAVGWIGYSVLSPIAIGSDNVVLVFFSEFLAGLTIKGVSSLPLALLPLGSLGGATVLKWKKWVWAIAYAVGVAAFTVVLLGVPQSFREIPGDFARWISLFIVFGVLAVAIWVIDNVLVARRKKRTPAPEPESEVAAELPAE